jgi:hypothetical protein
MGERQGARVGREREESSAESFYREGEGEGEGARGRENGRPTINGGGHYLNVDGSHFFTN